MWSHSPAQPSDSSQAAALLQPARRRGGPLAEEALARVGDVLGRVVDVEHPAAAGQLLGRGVPDPRRPVAQRRDRRRVGQPQPGRPRAQPGGEPLDRLDRRERHPRRRRPAASGCPTPPPWPSRPARVGRRCRSSCRASPPVVLTLVASSWNSTSPAAAANAAPAAGGGVERGDPARLGLAGQADGLVADGPAAARREHLAGGGEGELAAGQADQPGGLAGQEAVQAEQAIDVGPALAAARAGEVGPQQLRSAQGGHHRPRRPPLVAAGRAAGAAATECPTPTRAHPGAVHPHPGLPLLRPAALGGQQAPADRRHPRGARPLPPPGPQLPQPRVPSTPDRLDPSRRGGRPCRSMSSAWMSSPWSAGSATPSTAASRRSMPI